MSFKCKQISRRELLAGGAKAAAGILAATTLSSCTTTRTALVAEDLVTRDSEHINMVIWYEVDPTWPQRPARLTWGQTPGVAVDQEDRVWVFTRSEPPVQVYDADGRFIRAWGENMVDMAHYLKIDHDGNIWIADCGRHVVRKLTAEGKLLLTLGMLDEPGNDEKHFNLPTDMAIAHSGDVFVADGYGNTRIVHFDSKGRFIKAWGKKGTGPGEFNLPHAIAVDSTGRLYIADRDNARVEIFDQSGEFLAEWRNILVPWGFWVSEADDIWVCGSSPMRWRKGQENLGCPPKDQLFMKFNPAGKVLQHWTVPKGRDGREKSGEVNWVHGIALDSKGNVYLSDIIGKRIQKFVRHVDPRA